MKKLLTPAIVVIAAIPSLFCSNSNSAPSDNESEVQGIAYSDSVIKPTGMIAYIRKDSEIRLIDSNGNNDKLLWAIENPKENIGLYDLAWRPDGKELAFSSGHEAIFSLYHADIYAIRPDGSGLRKITNSPDHKQAAKFKKGSVSVTIKNFQYTFQEAQASTGVFIVNVVGADEPQMITLPPGSSKTLVFKNVADYGDHAQAVVASYGSYRWFMPAYVTAGQNTKLPDFIVSGDGMEYFGAFRPMWNQDGSQITYRDGHCLVKTIPAKPNIGEFYYVSLFGKKDPQGACVWDMNPAPGKGDQVLYSDNEGEGGSGFYVMMQGSDHDPSTLQTYYSDLGYQIANDVRWLPDGSGFLFSTVTRNEDYQLLSNIYHFDLRTKQTRQVTNVKNAYARRFAVSPSGKWIVYERCKKGADDDNEMLLDLMVINDVDLHLIRLDGTGDKLLVKDATGPSWSK